MVVDPSRTASLRAQAAGGRGVDDDGPQPRVTSNGCCAKARSASWPKATMPITAARWRTIRSASARRSGSSSPSSAGWRCRSPKSFGGLGGGAVEIGILMEAFGRGLVSEPYVATVVLGAALIEQMRQRRRRSRRRLPKVADGSLKLAFAHSERAARFDLAKVATVADRDGARLAPCRQQDRGARRPRRRRDHRLRACPRPSGDLRAGSACSWCRRRRRASPSPTIERLGGGRACNIELSDVELPEDALLGDGSDALPAIEWAVDRAMAALGAEAVGIMQTLLDTTLEYTKIRKQFGRPLSANQVIRHRLADMAMQVDEARSMALRAALKVDAAPVERAPRCLRRESEDRQMRALRRRAVDPASWRHGRHRGARGRRLFQAAGRLRHAVRRQRAPLQPPRPARPQSA